MSSVSLTLEFVFKTNKMAQFSENILGSKAVQMVANPDDWLIKATVPQASKIQKNKQWDNKESQKQPS